MQGRVRRYSDYNGYGFIEGDDGHDYFVHQSNIQMNGYRILLQDQRVSYDVAQTHKGYHAINVIPIGTSSIIDEIELNIEKNPFTPQEPIAIPSKFAGRQRETISAIRALINGSNLLIHGPRGIGKSSFAQQLAQVQCGNYELLERYKIKTSTLNLNNIICRYGCVPNDTLEDIANGLIKALNYELTGNILLPEITVQDKFETESIKKDIITANKTLSLSEIANDFSLVIRQGYNAVSENHTGITFLIDEIDVLHKDIMVAPFLKSVCESIPYQNASAFNFILCGVTGTITRLIHEHKSSSRLFEPIELTTMNDDELSELVTLALKGCSKTISNDAMKMISSLSNKYPHPAQQLGYFSFEFCNTGIISIDDVDNARRHIATTIKESEYNTKLTKSRDSVQSKLLMFAASICGDNFLFSQVRDNLREYDEDQLLSGLINLQKEEVFDKTRKGNSTFYSFREPLFKTFIRVTYQIDK